MSVILGLVFALILVVGYQYRGLFSFVHYNGMYRSALHRIEQPAQQPTEHKQCPQCNRDMRKGYVMIRYSPQDHDLSFLLHSYDPFHLATGTVETMLTRFPFAPNATYRPGYRCPTCGIIHIDD